MSQNESYHVNESLRNDLRLRKILDELPEFASRYFYANEFSLSARTRVAYAYDLRTFFRYIITKNPCRANDYAGRSGSFSITEYKNNFKRRRNIEFVAKRKYIFALTVFPVSHNPSPIFIVNC